MFKYFIEMYELKIEQAQKHLGFTIGKNRKRENVELRGVIFKLIRENDEYIPLQKIGKLFNKDHSTVIYALNNIDNWLFQNKKLFKVYQDLKPIFDTTPTNNVIIRRNGEVIENYQGLKNIKMLRIKNNFYIDLL
jgi:hypothetical protein